jgi:hypothetical protein
VVLYSLYVASQVKWCIYLNQGLLRTGTGFFTTCKRLRLIKLYYCSILQHDDLVGNRPSLECMIRSALKTSASHGSNSSSVRLMGHRTNEHIAQLDLGENLSTPSGLVTLIPHLGQGLECPVRRAQALHHIAVTLRPGHT